MPPLSAPGRPTGWGPWLCGLLLALGSWGCDPLDPLDAEGEGRCPPAGCPLGQRCALGACVGGGTPEYLVDLRIAPPTDRPFAPVEVEGIRFLDGPSLVLPAPLPVPAPVAFTGQATGPDGTPLVAQASARPNRGIPVRPQVVVSEALTNPGNPGFRLALAPWWPTPDGGARQINYRLLIQPTGLPAWRVDALQVEPDRLTARYPLPASAGGALPAIEGQVLVSQANPTPLRDLIVLVLDASGRSVGAATRTDAQGRFRVPLWPAERERSLTLQISSDRREQPLPVLRWPLTLSPGAVPEPLVMRYGDIGRLFEIVGRIGDVTAPLSGATVRLTAAVGAGEYRITTLTDEAGRFAARIYPGDYLIDVDPALDPTRPARLTRRAATLAPGGPPLLVVPLPRSRVFGTAVDSAGQPLADATLEAVLLEARYGDPRLNRPGEVPPARTVIGRVGSDGAFDIALDPGRHRLVVTPPPGTGLPAFSQEFSFSGESARPAEVGVLAAPPGAALRLQLTDERGAVLSGATVEAWIRGEAAPAARGQTDRQGQLTLALPNPPPQAPEDPPDGGAP